MSPLKRTVILGILVLLFEHQLEARIVSININRWSIQKHATFIYGSNIANLEGIHLYMICKEEQFPAELDCNVTLETPTAIKDSPTKTTCPVKLIAAENRRLLYVKNNFPVKLDQLNKNGVVLFWIEGEKNSNSILQYLKFQVLNLTDCSSVQLPEFAVDKYISPATPSALIYSHSFDILAFNQSTCNGLSICRLSYDEHGRRVGEPAAFNTSLDIFEVKPVSSTSADKGFFVSGLNATDLIQSESKIIIEHVSATGFGTNLILNKISKHSDVYWASSNTHERYGLCWVIVGGSRVHCTQVDASGKAIRTSLNFAKPVVTLVVHNLAKGGMLLASLDCNEENKCHGFKIRKINADGSKEDGMVEMTSIDKECDDVRQKISYGAFENSIFHCFYYICPRSTTGRKVTTIAQQIIQCVGK